MEELGFAAVAALPLATGVWLLAAGLLFRSGRLRALGSWYFRRGLPFYARNFVFGAIPVGVSGILLFLVFPLALPDTPWAGWLSLALIPLMALSTLLGIVFMIFPPHWLRPAWIRERERAIRDGRPGDSRAT